MSKWRYKRVTEDNPRKVNLIFRKADYFAAGLYLLLIFVVVSSTYEWDSFITASMYCIVSITCGILFYKQEFINNAIKQCSAYRQYLGLIIAYSSVLYFVIGFQLVEPKTGYALCLIYGLSLIGFSVYIPRLALEVRYQVNLLKYFRICYINADFKEVKRLRNYVIDMVQSDGYYKNKLTSILRYYVFSMN